MEWPGALYHIFLDPNQQLYADHGQQWSWWEYGCYVGVLPLVLGAVGVMGAVRRHWPLLLAGAVFLAVGLGGWGPSAPWYWLHQLPPFSSHHVPSRLLVGAVLVLSLLAGFGLSCLQLKAARWSLAPALLLIAVAADLTWVHRPVWRAAFSISPTAVSWSPVFRQTAGYPLRHPRIGPYLYPGLMSNRGVVRSEAEVHHQPKAIPHGAPSYRGELFLADSARGSATFSEWSPNKLTVDLALGSPGRLVINQNHDHNWRVFGRQVESYRGLLSVSVDPRDRSVTFYYLPWSVLAGLAITLLGLVAASWFIWSDRSARPRPAEPRS